MLDLEGVRRRHRGAGDVLRGVDLRIGSGGPCVVTGANGSGKSTLLRVAAGVTTPSAGRVRGRPSVVGFLPAPFPASSRLTVRSYLRHLGAMHGGGRRAARRSAVLLERLGFTGSRDAALTELSTGNAQKVGLAQALCASPDLVVLDEPWTALDARAARVLDQLLGELSRGAALLIADHSGRGSALPHARLHHLRDGRVHEEHPDHADTDSSAVGRDWCEIELWCPVSAERTLTVAPPVLASRCDGRSLWVRVERSSSDAWLVAALALGCSITSVRREPRAGP